MPGRPWTLYSSRLFHFTQHFRRWSRRWSRRQTLPITSLEFIIVHSVSTTLIINQYPCPVNLITAEIAFLAQPRALHQVRRGRLDRHFCSLTLFYKNCPYRLLSFNKCRNNRDPVWPLQPWPNRQNLLKHPRFSLRRHHHHKPFPQRQNPAHQGKLR